MNNKDLTEYGETFFSTTDGYVLRSNVISGLYRAGFRKAADYCKAIPVVPTVMQPKGKWVWQPDRRWWQCDQCGEKTTDTCMGVPRANYCPWCGADMRGDTDA